MENKSTEIWKPLECVPGIEGQFEISSFGRVKRIKFNSYTKTELKKLTITATGYYHVTFWIEGKTRPMRIHRLVAKTFIPNPDNLKEVNHIDGDKSNNRVDNLEWSTRSLNNKHKYDVLGYTNKNRHRWSEEEKQIISQRLKEYYRTHPKKQRNATKDF